MHGGSLNLLIGSSSPAACHIPAHGHSSWAEWQPRLSVPFSKAYPESHETHFEDILKSVLESRHGLLFQAFATGLL